MPTEPNQPPPHPIIIVGAGPSGLLLALLLAQHDIPSTVLESWPHLDTRLRATQYGVPATRIFRRAGLLPDFRAASIPKFPTICWRRVADGGTKLLEIDMSVIEHEEDRMTVLPLGEMIQIMYRHCRERFPRLIDVRFGETVVGVGQDASRGDVAWVDVGDDGMGASRRRLEADYVVGCDGASSAVRRSLFGKGWPGRTFDCRFVVQNVYYDGFERHGWDGGNYMVDREHWGLIAKRGHGGLWRVTYGDPAVGLTDEEYLARRPWHLKAMLPGNPEPHEYRIEGTNLYDVHNRCVDAFRVGRILLAADAAHVVNPMGGCMCDRSFLISGSVLTGCV
jgi:2-polyprenyl-6-methoxyphenol hydroxylase-like FAD-dependent oxidoreductase